LSFYRAQSRVVIGLLTGHNTLRRNLSIMGLSDNPIGTGDPWYISNRQIHEDLGVPLFGHHIRALSASFDSKLADAGNPL
jgi:hypothetical protein